ncbi:cyclase family protein [Salinibacter sp.]|uniref:cyclase family protein n=1 Tax=Salinibacter sp. TaxID=2065818 RepID=UPI0021E73852|nr:cyclase family protein [Salinibacter sp.]
MRLLAFGPFAFAPTSPVCPGFDNATFRATAAGNAIPGCVEEGEPYTYDEQGFVATSYVLPTGQYSTQFDPPAHWNENGVLRPAPADSAQ